MTFATADARGTACVCGATDDDEANLVILDDMFDMGELAARHVRVSPLTGLSADVVLAALRLWALA